MPLEAPPWWYGRRYAMVSHALLPIAAIYGALAARRMAQPPQATSALPVICVGNFTAGGTGKTPFALHIASRLIAQGHCPVFLTRGYGGSLKGPVLVDRDAHTAQDVGDEPLLLAASASTVVARAREMGLALIAERNAHADSAARHDVIIMDDGLQNPRVKKDLTFALIDAERGLGNARVIPAGPLRAPLDRQRGHVDAVVMVHKALAGNRSGDGGGAGSIDAPVRPTLLTGLARFDARVRIAGDVDALRGRPAVAFAGIGNPAPFFDSVARVTQRPMTARFAFADHKPLSERDAARVLAAATHDGLIVTTAKDHVRLTAQTPACAQLKARAHILNITIDVDQAEAFDATLADLFKANPARP